MHSLVRSSARCAGISSAFVSRQRFARGVRRIIRATNRSENELIVKTWDIRNIDTSRPCCDEGTPRALTSRE
jgi:hypothetical protein